MNIQEIETMDINEMKQLLIKYVEKENKLKERRRRNNADYYKKKTSKSKST
tara:strand:+ start:331 stop:483 length:153 start_codon:yes stop_codon:yes gene_type:complete